MADTTALARMLETIDLLGKVTASISERMDRQEQQLGILTALVEDCRQRLDDAQAKAQVSTNLRDAEAHLLRSALADLKQRTTDLRALYAEADRYFEQVKESGKNRSWF